MSDPVESMPPVVSSCSSSMESFTMRDLAVSCIAGMRVASMPGIWLNTSGLASAMSFAMRNPWA